jgi:hypothetical protein
VVSGSLPERGYLWQRDWTPAVADAVREGQQHLDGVIVLGAEITWRDGVPQPIEANIAWSTLRDSRRPCALALRIAPYPGPFADNDATARALANEAAALLRMARANGVEPTEFEVDFDCAAGRLAGYAAWLRALAPVVRPTRLVITTLPAWLDAPDFPALIGSVDGYVLQVHSVPTVAESGRASLCDPVLAQKWVAKAARLGRPFSVALPTYGCLAGYAPSGKLLGVAMDSVQPAWPTDTTLLEFRPDADAIADLVRAWRMARPAELREIIWYRLPVATDLRNWRWSTLLPVTQGRRPLRRLEIAHDAGAPVDFSIANAGEAEEDLNCDVVVRWTGSRLVACDALPGWSVAPGDGQAVFTTTTDRARLRLRPGSNLNIGWLRFDQAPALQTDLVRHD